MNRSVKEYFKTSSLIIWGSSFLFLLLLVSLPLEHRLRKPSIFLSSLFEQTRGNYSLPQFFDLSFWLVPADILAFLLVLSLLVLKFFKSVSIRSLASDTRAPFNLLISFLGVVFISILYATTPTLPVHYFCFVQLILSVSLFYIASLILFSQRSYTLIWGILCGIGAIQAVMAIGQYIHQGPLGLHFLGEFKHVYEYNILSHFNKEHVGLLKRFFQEGLPIIRGQGTFRHANHLGGFLVVSISATYYLFCQTRFKFIATLAFIIQFTGLIISFSRSAWIGWGIMTVCWVYLLWNTSFISRKLVGALCTVVTLVCLLFSSSISARGNYAQFDHPSKQTFIFNEGNRLKAQTIAWKMFLDHPCFGVGFGHFTQNYDLYLDQVGPLEGEPYTHVHNIYLLILAETGILGFGCFAAFLLILFKRSWPYRKSIEMASLMASLLALLWIGCCDFYPFVDQTPRMLFLILAALMMREVLIHQKSSGKTISKSEEGSLDKSAFGST